MVKHKHKICMHLVIINPWWNNKYGYAVNATNYREHLLRLGKMLEKFKIELLILNYRMEIFISYTITYIVTHFKVDYVGRLYILVEKL